MRKIMLGLVFGLFAAALTGCAAPPPPPPERPPEVIERSKTIEKEPFREVLPGE